ncbi:hypothetical protein, partial [Pseudonocardia pini]|uniref:hypothetical protein n=1 Tax=Pseudonocardia pini TaxID=2758030 RepID=UPI001C6897F1
MNVQAPTAAQAGGPLAAAQARRQEGYRAAGHWSGQTLHQLVGRVLAAHPALRVANSTEELSLTEVWAAALTYAEALR